jgi:hypothetical protein
MADDNDDEGRPDIAKLDSIINHPRWGGNQESIGANILPSLNSSKEAIDWINKEYATIILNGKYRILREKNDSTIEFMDKKDFVNNLSHMRLAITNNETGAIKFTPITDIWFASGEKRKFNNGIVFDPRRIGHYNEMYNLWKGYKIVGMPGDVSMWLDFMKTVICDNNENHYNFLVALIAQMFQRPWDKPGIAVVIRGDEGVGKSFFIEKLGALMSPYCFKTSNQNNIFGDHNGHIKNCILLHLEEAVWAGSKKDESLLKELITGQTIDINDKFIPVYMVANYLHLFMSGNPDWLVSAHFKARRILALHANEARIRDTSYFADLHQWFLNGGAGALIHFFLNYDYSGVNLRIVPATDELIFQKRQSMSGVSEWWHSICDTKEFPYGDIQSDGSILVIKNLLYDDYRNSTSGRRHPLSAGQFGIQFLGLLPRVVGNVEQRSANGRVSTIVKVDNIKIEDNRGIRREGYHLPNIEICRNLIEFKLGGSANWSTIVDNWTVLRNNTDFDFSNYKSGG